VSVRLWANVAGALSTYSVDGDESCTIGPLLSGMPVSGPFENLSVGDSGDGLLVGGGAISWTRIAK
jgi:hypothetical protein